MIAALPDVAWADGPGILATYVLIGLIGLLWLVWRERNRPIPPVTPTPAEWARSLTSEALYAWTQNPGDLSRADRAAVYGEWVNRGAPTVFSRKPLRLIDR